MMMSDSANLNIHSDEYLSVRRIKWLENIVNLDREIRWIFISSLIIDICAVILTGLYLDAVDSSCPKLNTFGNHAFNMLLSATILSLGVLALNLIFRSRLRNIPGLLFGFSMFIITIILRGFLYTLYIVDSSLF